MKMMDGMMSEGMTAGMGLWMVLFLVTVVALLVLAAVGTVSVYRRLRTRQGDVTAGGGDNARNRLRERYAAGEIDDEEYERRLSTLTHWS
jgi:putative membrane protein